MIYAISLGGFIKKNFANKTTQTNQDNLINNLPLDPKISGMDIVLLQQKDVLGFKGEKLLEALKTANPAISLMYVYTNDKELSSLKSFQLPMKKLSKINPEQLQNVVEAIIESKGVSEKPTTYIPSKDAQVSEDEEETSPELTEKIVEERREVSKLNIPEITEEEIATAGADLERELNQNIEVPKSRIAPLRKPSIEERITKLGEHADFDLFKHALNKDTIIKEIMTENTRFAGAVQMLDVLDREIANVFVSKDKPADEKMDIIKGIALRRVAFKEETNNILVDKISSVIYAIIASTEVTMDRRVKEAKLALDTVASSKILYQDEEVLNNLIQERLEMQVTLHEMQAQLITLYQQIDKSIKTVIGSFDEGLPSENSYINEHFKILKPIFTPENASELTQRLLQDLTTGRVKLSMMENQLTEVVKLVFALCEKDTSIIDYQQKLITLLKSNRVENTIIVTTVLKSCMRLFIGPSEVGTRTTAIIWGGMMSRRQNVLLIDLSGKSKFREYGIEPSKLDDFLNEPTQEHFLCVEGLVDDNEERIDDIITELKMRLNYYPYINVILDPAQKTAIRKFSEEALTAHFITDSTPRSIYIMKEVITNFRVENIAKKVVMIAPAVDPIKMCNELGVDTMDTKMIALPYMQRIRALAFNKISPHTDKEILEIFEEAFK